MVIEMKNWIFATLVILFGFGLAFAENNYQKCYNACSATSDKCYKVCKSDAWCKKKCNQNFNECTARCSTNK